MALLRSSVFFNWGTYVQFHMHLLIGEGMVVGQNESRTQWKRWDIACLNPPPDSHTLHSLDPSPNRLIATCCIRKSLQILIGCRNSRNEPQPLCWRHHSPYAKNNKRKNNNVSVQVDAMRTHKALFFLSISYTNDIDITINLYSIWPVFVRGCFWG